MRRARRHTCHIVDVPSVRRRDGKDFPWFAIGNGGAPASALSPLTRPGASVDFRMIMSAPPPQDLPDLSGLTLLVVDDDADTVEVLSTFLTACRAHVLFARSASGALAYVDKAPRLDAVITDLSMPQMDGIELLRRIRQHPSRPTVPVIALTGFEERYSETHQFDAFLQKPTNFDELCRVVKDVVARRRPA
jgi:diguanylate cyclase